MYKNLEAEMVRKGVTRKDISSFLKVRYATILDKLSGKYSFKLEEAFKIKQKFFPSLSVEYLFERESEIKNAS